MSIKGFSIGGVTQRYDYNALDNKPQGEGLSEEAKQALLQLAQKVAYIDDQGQTYYDDLYNALYPPKTVVLITAVFEQGSTVIYDDTALDDLKQYLTVTAKFSDNTTAILADGAYTLSGLLEAPSSTVTVLYNGVSTTFSVAVTARPTLSSITAVYTQSGTVYTHDALDSLKADLVVTAHYTDSSTETVPAADYTLSGTLAAGTSTITVSYGGKTTTFNVTVTAGVPSTYQMYDYITMPNNVTNASTDKWLQLKQYDNLNVLSVELAVKPVTGHGDGTTIFGRRVSGTSGAASSFGLYCKIGLLSWQLHGATPASDAYRPNLVEDGINIIYYTNTSVSPSSIKANNDAAITVTWVNNNTLNIAPVLFTNPNSDSSANFGNNIQLGYTKFFDLSGDLVSHYFPVVRKSDNVIGMFDIVGQTFYTTSTANYAKIGNAYCIYAVGNWS